MRSLSRFNNYHYDYNLGSKQLTGTLPKSKHIWRGTSPVDCRQAILARIEEDPYQVLWRLPSNRCGKQSWFILRPLSRSNRVKWVTMLTTWSTRSVRPWPEPILQAWMAWLKIPAASCRECSTVRNAVFFVIRGSAGWIREKTARSSDALALAESTAINSAAAGKLSANIPMCKADECAENRAVNPNWLII